MDGMECDGETEMEAYVAASMPRCHLEQLKELPLFEYDHHGLFAVLCRSD